MKGARPQRYIGVKLTETQQKIWELYKLGLSYKEISRRLGRKSSGGIDATIDTIKAKLGPNA